MTRKNSDPAGDSDDALPIPIDHDWKSGLAVLCAHTYARDAGADLWDFALRIDDLRDAGLSISDVRWLVARGLATHGQETSVHSKPHRSFVPSIGFSFKKTTCLVLTEQGVAFAQRVLQETAQARSIATAAARSLLEDTPPANHAIQSQSSVKPHWDPVRRELSVAGTIMKRFRVPAPNQELILSAFQEEGWPDHIDDPLPGNGNGTRKARLHDAINRLNGNQLDPGLSFHGNGNGNGVCWRLAGRS